MIKRTPQEIADFFGGYVAQDKSDRWYVYQKRPRISIDTWDSNGGDICIIGDDLLDIPADHDWTVLYEPRLDNKSEINYQNQPEVDNKAPHQSEVHVEKEYVLLGEFQPGTLMYKVNELLKDGFRLYGNTWTGPDSSYGYIHYQAMVRGV